MSRPGHILRAESYTLCDFTDDADSAALVVRGIQPDMLCVHGVQRHPLSSQRKASFAARCGLNWSSGHREVGGTTVMSTLQMDVQNVQHRPL